MKNLVIALSLLVTANTANALSNNTKYVAKDSSIESNLCVIAATQGFQAAKLAAKEADSTLNATTCNGVSVKAFSNNSFGEKAKVVRFVPANQSTESKICAQAVVEGVAAVIKAHSADARNVVCNGQTLVSFVKSNTGS